MARIKLDKIDRRILSDLQDNGRISNVRLAENAGISPPPCLRRVRALESDGLIKGYHAYVDQAALGYNITVFAMVNLSAQADKDLKAFEERIRQMPQVRECHMLAGDVDFMLKIVARDWEEYQTFLTNELNTAPNIKTVKSSMCLRISKDEPGVPIDN